MDGPLPSTLPWVTDSLSRDQRGQGAQPSQRSQREGGPHGHALGPNAPVPLDQFHRQPL